MTTKRETKDVYEIIREKIVTSLESGTIPWQKPWNSKAQVNAISKRPYSGINVFLLPRTYADNRWVTYKQAGDLGGNVRKGEKSSMVVFWMLMKKEDESGKEKTIPLLRYYNVFNVEQCENLTKLSALEPTVTASGSLDRIETADAIIAAMPNAPRIYHSQTDRAFYSPSADSVHLPPRETFKSVDAYYATKFHELTHSTGHRSRLDRFTEEEQTFVFRSDTYSKEELTAEFGSAFLCGLAGIDNTDVLENSAAYINNWLSAIKGADKRMLVQAASKAQKAADYIIAATETEEGDDESPAPSGAALELVGAA